MKTTLLVLCALILLMTPHLLASLPDTLNEEQTRFAEEMEEFTDKMEAKFFEAIARLNGSKDVQTKRFEVDTADYVVKVARGPVIEKGGFMRSVVKKALGFTPEPLLSPLLISP